MTGKELLMTAAVLVGLAATGTVALVVIKAVQSPSPLSARDMAAYVRATCREQLITLEGKRVNQEQLDKDVNACFDRVMSKVDT